MCLWVKGRSQLYCHNRLQAGEPKNSAELTLGGQRSTGEGRQVDRANLLVTVAAAHAQTHTNFPAIEMAGK